MKAVRTVSVRQRVEILKMLYRSAEIMIFDEPTAVLTPQEIDFLLQIIDNLRKRGCTLVITGKRDDEAVSFDRVITLEEGSQRG